jgi:tRNA-specific 2-thiouridylase
MKKVIVAMSGGVDSSVAAALLQRQGFEVEGMFMKNWSPDSIQGLTDCPWEEDQADAAAVCEKLGIPFRSINFEKEYKERVVDYFLAEYAAGRTPNPDVMCNKEIKFKAFLAEAEKMGADLIATGHYAQKLEKDGRLYVGRGMDAGKDQSYFLWNLNQDQLARTIFPLGELPKSEVRKLAEEFGLPTAKKKDSQGICFIGHIDLKKFLFEHLTSQPGEVFLLSPYESGRGLDERLQKADLIGRHRGSIFHTIGERAGELIDNGLYRKLRNGQDVPPVYVLYKDTASNRLYLTDDAKDPQLSSGQLVLEQWHLNEGDKSESLTCQVRYQQREVIEIQSISKEGNDVRVSVSPALWAVAPGQSLVIYNGSRLVGGGVVKEVIV